MPSLRWPQRHRRRVFVLALEVGQGQTHLFQLPLIELALVRQFANKGDLLEATSVGGEKREAGTYLAQTL